MNQTRSPQRDDASIDTLTLGDIYYAVGTATKRQTTRALANATPDDYPRDVAGIADIVGSGEDVTHSMKVAVLHQKYLPAFADRKLIAYDGASYTIEDADLDALETILHAHQQVETIHDNFVSGDGQ